VESEQGETFPDESSSELPTIPKPLPERRIDEIEGDGPILIAIGGLHGNEQGGVEALERVCRALRTENVELKGTLVAMRGNRPALRANVRTLGRDLNRLWFPASLDLMQAQDPSQDDATDQEFRELWWEIKAIFEQGRPVYLLDLHSTSGEGPPFAVVLGEANSQRLGAQVGLPCVHGLNESIHGTLAGWFAQHYGASLVAEGGPSDQASTTKHLEEVVYSALAASGLMQSDHARVVRARQHLGQVTDGLPRHVDIFHREPAASVDFVMGELPTRRFQNFDAVHQDMPLARNRHGEILAPRDGYLIMPLYQDEGSDGFFLSAPCADPSA